jgi:hypothetical protein
MRRARRMSNGTVVVAEYDATGEIVRETYYTGDEAWVTKIVERGPAQPDSRDQN